MPAGTDPLRLGLIGEHDPSMTAHRTIPLAPVRACAGARAGRAAATRA